jgi:hypothetical protein
VQDGFSDEQSEREGGRADRHDQARERAPDIYDPHFPIRLPASGQAIFDRAGRETYDPHFAGQRRA